MSTTTQRPIECPTCTSDEVLTVSMSLADGAALFWSCARCEATGWDRGGTTLPRDAALASIGRR